MILKFYVPLLYSLETRFAHKSIIGVFLWILDYFLPIMALMFISLSMVNYFTFLVGVVAILFVYGLYEVGYIQNDAETIKGEENPTKRLSNNDILYYERHKFDIYTIRLIWGLAFSYFFFYIYPYSSIIVVLILMWMIVPLYLLYNSNRSKWCIVLLNILTSYRYIMPVILVIGRFDIISIGVAYFMHPFPTIIQQAVMSKFGVEAIMLKKYILSDFSKRYAFRVKYYFVMFLFLLVILLITGNNILYIFIPLYYLIYKFLMFFKYPGPIEDHR